MDDPQDPAVPLTAQPEIAYRHGLAVLWHVREAPDWMSYDARLGAYVAPGHRLPELREWAAARGIAEAIPQPDALEGPLFDARRPRPYQTEALERWKAAAGRGTVVLPTGAGKSFVAVLAIAETGRGACVVAPTRALLGQWFSQLADAFGAERVGAYYGEEKDLRPLTVTTYHSAFNVLERWGTRFDLLVLDEAHHLADTGDGRPSAWHDALRIAPAAHRLGLTATYPDGRDEGLRCWVGPVAYRKTIAEMADAELADFALERRFVSLTPGERVRYDTCTATYDSYVAKRRYRERYPDPEDAWRVFMAETRREPAARRAFRAFLERERIVALAKRKLAEAERLLRLFPAERAILFCGSAEAAERMSRRLAVPMIGADTPASERKALLDAVTSGTIRAVASVRVLDEGWDVPAAKLGIVLGDTSRGGARQHQQRLGRLLRRQGEQVASLYEIVVGGTHEFYASQKRGAAVRRARDRQLGLGF
ncbi:MAG: DEAD/DEAH box helicase [Gemmatimonadetes bacterium]|nr:DEAD/DEAH box helicase [Gemmatimonadota bacterium]